MLYQLSIRGDVSISFRQMALLTDSVISRLPISASVLFVNDPIMRNPTLGHNCTSWSSFTTTAELRYVMLILAFLHSLFFSGRQRQGGVMDLSKALCHRVAFRHEKIPLGRSWQHLILILNWAEDCM